MNVLVDMMVSRMSAYVEAHFVAQPGPPMAMFEIPQANADPVRAIYRTYAVRCITLPEVERWMMRNVIEPLARSCNHEGCLYWRLTEKFEVSFDDGNSVTLRTRIAVLNRALEPVLVGSEKAEGSPVLDLTYPSAVTHGSQQPQLEKWITIGDTKVHVGHDSGMGWTFNWRVDGRQQ